MIFILTRVIYVRYTVTSQDTNFGVDQASETAASVPWAWHVSHDVHDMRVMIFKLIRVLFMFVTQSRRKIPILVYMKLAKRPPAPHERGT